MAHGWTPERRKRQSELIRMWRPWERSTGPRTPEGKARSARRGFKGGFKDLRQTAAAELSAIQTALHELRKKVLNP